MARLMKYLKRSWLTIAAVVVLLIVQAACDLALPDYTSDIVNVGIQQGGIRDAVPEQIRLGEMERLKLMMSAADAEYTDGFYTDGGDGILYLGDITDDERARLNDVMGLPVAAVAALESDPERAAAIRDSISAALPQGALPEDADIFTVMGLLPQEQRAEMSDAMREQFAAYSEMGGSLVTQMGAAFVKSEYQAVGVDTDKLQSDYIWRSGLKMLGMAAVVMICAALVTLLASIAGSRFGHDLRSAVFGKVLSFSSKEYNDFSTASLITRCTNDVQQVQLLVIMLLRMVIYAPIIGVGALVKVFAMDGGITWIIGAAILAILVLIIILMTVAMPRFRRLQVLVDKLNLVAREILNGIPVIRAFSREEHENKRFDGANTDLMRTQLFVNRVMAAMMPVMMLIMNCVMVLIIWVGGGAVDTGAMQVGDIMAFMQYSMQIIMAFLMLSMTSIMLPRALVAAGRISEVLGAPVSVKDPDSPVSPDPAKRGTVEFRDVYFRYPGAQEDVLRNISFTAQPGETTAFIGSTGSGKSTLINLIPRFFDVTGGKILVSGVDIRKMSKHDLRGMIGYVPQKGMLFSGTIGSNIAYGAPDADDAQIERAAQVAQAADFIEEKEDKYDSAIAQGGANVSGGQRQRLAIARAVAKNPDIYIFDDSFSALDYRTDAALRRALAEHTKDGTVLIVAQRISTVMNADRIVVLNDGEVAGIGTHSELLERCEVYRQIAVSQLSEEEL